MQNFRNEVTLLLYSPFKSKICTHTLISGIRLANFWQNVHVYYCFIMIKSFLISVFGSEISCNLIETWLVHMIKMN